MAGATKNPALAGFGTAALGLAGSASWCEERTHKIIPWPRQACPNRKPRHADRSSPEDSKPSARRGRHCLSRPPYRRPQANRLFCCAGSDSFQDIGYALPDGHTGTQWGSWRWITLEAVGDTHIPKHYSSLPLSSSSSSALCSRRHNGASKIAMLPARINACSPSWSTMR